MDKLKQYVDKFNQTMKKLSDRASEIRMHTTGRKAAAMCNPTVHGLRMRCMVF